MRNDISNWAAPHQHKEAQTEGGVTIQQIALPRQTIVSGVSVLRHFDDALGPLVGWPDVAQGPSYAVVLRRDRVLLVNGPSLVDGWNEATGQAVSDLTGGYAVFEIWGNAVFDVLKRGADIDPNTHSRSAARKFADASVILYRFQDQNRVRLHVDVANEAAVQRALYSYQRQIE